MISRLSKWLLGASFLMLLAGCEPTMFGMPQAQWNQLTPEQKSQVIQGYNQREQIKEQNAPLYAAIDAANNVLTSNQATSTNPFPQATS